MPESCVLVHRILAWKHVWHVLSSTGPGGGAVCEALMVTVGPVSQSVLSPSRPAVPSARSVPGPVLRLGWGWLGLRRTKGAGQGSTSGEKWLMRDLVRSRDGWWDCGNRGTRPRLRRCRCRPRPSSLTGRLPELDLMPFRSAISTFRGVPLPCLFAYFRGGRTLTLPAGRPTRVHARFNQPAAEIHWTGPAPAPAPAPAPTATASSSLAASLCLPSLFNPMVAVTTKWSP